MVNVYALWFIVALVPFAHGMKEPHMKEFAVGLLPTTPLAQILANFAEHEALDQDMIDDSIESLARLQGEFYDRSDWLEAAAMLKEKHKALRKVVQEVAQYRSPYMSDPVGEILNKYDLWLAFFNYQDNQFEKSAQERWMRYSELQDWYDVALNHMVKCDKNLPTLRALLNARLGPISTFHTEIFHATHAGAGQCVQWLLSIGRNPDRCGSWLDPLSQAIQVSRLDIAEDLLKAGSRVDYGMCAACQCGFYDAVLLCMHYGASPDDKGVSGTMLDYAKSALEFAREQHNIEWEVGLRASIMLLKSASQPLAAERSNL